MGYIMDLRKVIGTQPIIMVGACVIVVDSKNRILLQLRQDNHSWGLAGGAMEPGETLEQVAKRELLEETGLIASELELLNIYSGEEFYYKYPHGDEVYNVITAYVCRDYHGEIKMDEQEVAELKFYGLDELPTNLNPPERPIIEDFLSKVSAMNQA